jgi:hypothetical protein
MTPIQYRNALRRLDLSQVGAARLFGADDRTGRRWISGERAVPECVAIVLRLLVAGKITTKDGEPRKLTEAWKLREREKAGAPGQIDRARNAQARQAPARALKTAKEGGA